MNERNAILLMFLLLALLNFSCKKQKSDLVKNYSPTTVGSTWNYEGYLVESTANRMTGRTVKKFGKDYYEKSVSTITESFSYFGAKEGDNYYTIVVNPNVLKEENEVLYLKANGLVGETWINEIKYGSDVLGTQWEFKIIEKNITKNVDGKTFTDVIHTERISNGLTLDSYYALGVGLIEVNYSNGAKSILKSYDIK